MYEFLDYYLKDNIVDELFGFLAALGILLVQYLARVRAKLIYGRANNSRNVVFSPGNDESGAKIANEIYVEKYFIQNVGKATATNVEFVLSSKPTDVSIYPPTTIKEQFVGHGEWHISIPQIAPSELIIVTCLYLNQKAAWVTSLKSAETVGNEVQFLTQRQYGRVFTTFVAILMFAGLVSILTVFARLVF